MSYFWPPDGNWVTGIPASVLNRLTRPIIFDTFQGAETASRTADQWVDATVGTGIVTQGANPDTGDEVTNGIVQLVVTADPVADSAARKNGTNAVAVDGFGPDPRMYAVRIQNRNVVAPSPTEYELSLIEITRRVTVQLPPADGVEIVFDPTLGFASYRVRSWVAGVAEDGPDQLLAHDMDYHVVGFLVSGTGITAFVDGEVFPEFVPTIIQPTVVCSGKFSNLNVVPGGAESPTVHCDWACHS